MSEKCHPVWRAHLRQQPFKFSKGVKVRFTNPQAIVLGVIYQPFQELHL